MAKSINQKYLDATEAAFYDARFDPSEFAIYMSRQPVVTQTKFFSMIAAYVDTIASYIERGFVPLGMRDIGYACGEIQEVIDDYFPEDKESNVVRFGMEWEQIHEHRDI